MLVRGHAVLTRRKLLGLHVGVHLGSHSRSEARRHGAGQVAKSRRDVGSAEVQPDAG